MLSVSQIKRETKKTTFHAWKDSGYYSDRRENLKHRKNQEARTLSFRESFVSVCGVWTRGVHM